MNIDSGLAQGSQRAVAGEIRQSVIRSRRNAKIDAHTAPRRETHCRLENDIRYKVGRHREHAVARLETRIDEQRMHRVFALVRTAGEELREPAAACTGGRIWRQSVVDAKGRGLAAGG